MIRFQNITVSTTILRPLALSAALAALPMTGCMTPRTVAERAIENCDEAMQKGKKKLEDHFAEARRCCLKLLPDNPAGYADCEKAVNDAKKEADRALAEAEAACIEANFTLLEEQVEFIFNAIDRIIDLACGPLEVFQGVVESENGEARNLTEPLPDVERVSIRTSGVVMQSVEGSSRFFTQQVGWIQLIGGPDHGGSTPRIQVLVDADAPQGRRAGVVRRLDISIQGLGKFVLAPDSSASIRGDGGRMTIDAVVFDPAHDSPTARAVSLPFDLRGGVGSIRTAGWVSIDEILPVAPNGVADWHRDFVVDEYDYAAFLADFSNHQIDLDGDGAATTADVEYFEHLWIEAMQG
ncbi:MAG: hypothetical protein VX672_05045 [Planctomycetota bacterium]|nr:hypothetical protein [Planctomycetota bacterium]